MTAGLATLKQFTVSDRKLLIQDVEFWASAVDTALQFYKETSLNSEEDKAAKAVACARLAGLGLAMVQHFQTGVQSLISDVNNDEDPDTIACQDAGERMVELSLRHAATLEDRSKASIN